LHAKPMTGRSPEQLELLIDRVADQVGTWQPPRGRHRRLDLAAAVTMTLCGLRHNLPQALLGAFWGSSQATASRVISRLRELVCQAANQGMPGWPTHKPGSGCCWTDRCCPLGGVLASRDRTWTAASGTGPGCMSW
jgi:hypothetical protein